MRLIDADKVIADAKSELYTAQEVARGDIDNAAAFRWYWNDGVKTVIDLLDTAPTIESTLYGYNIEHLAYIACLMKEGNITAEDVAGQFMDITRMVTLVIQRMNEKIKDKIINGGWNEYK